MTSPNLSKRAHRLWNQVCEDHSRLALVLEDVRWLVEQHAFHSAARRFGEFRLIEEQHMLAEEAIFGEASVRGVPAEHLRAEHREIRRLLEDAAQAISRWEIERFRIAIVALQRAIAEHEERERVWLVRNGALRMEAMG